ncbi:MAG: hypothetical protein AB7W28_08250 [Armatimonadota bacterium]
MACAVLLYAVLLGTPTTAAAGLMSETFDYADGLLPGDRWTMTGGEFLCRAGQLYVVSERSNPIVAWRGELANDVTVEARLINAPTCHWSGLQVKSRFRVAVNRQFGHLAISDEQAEGGPKVLAECPNWTTYVNDPFDFRLRVALQGSRICAFADDRLMAEAYHPEASGKGGLALLGGWGTTVAWDDIIVHEGADLHTRPQEVPVGIKQSSLLAITAARWDDPHGLYAPGQKASLAMTIANPREGQFSGVVRLRLVDFWGNVVGAQTLRINLPPGGKTDLVPLITPPGPGVFKVAVDISAGKGGLEWLEDLRLDGDANQDEAVGQLIEAGQPVVQIDLGDVYDLGREFFRWEVATAVAAHLMGVNPFNQPNVESAKKAARAATDAYKSTRRLPELEPSAQDEGLVAYSNMPVGSPEQALANLLALVRPGDYIALQAYLPPTRETTAALQRLRLALRDRYRVATTVGYGPRFLHSTGQLHKGDGNTGVFLQLTADAARDVPIPDEAGKDASSMTFGVLEAAQALGDRQALLDGGRRFLRLHLKGDVEAGLARLLKAVQ